CHESAEKSDPDCETQNTTTRLSTTVSALVEGATGGRCQNIARLVCTAEARHPPASPNRISAAIAPSLATVNVFWMSLPYSTPKLLVAVSSAITTKATNWA